MLKELFIKRRRDRVIYLKKYFFLLLCLEEDAGNNDNDGGEDGLDACYSVSLSHSYSQAELKQ